MELQLLAKGILRNAWVKPPACPNYLYISIAITKEQIERQGIQTKKNPVQLPGQAN